MSDAPTLTTAPGSSIFVSVDSPAERRKAFRHRARIPLVRVDAEMAIYSSFEDLSSPREKLPIRLLMSDITTNGLGFFSEKQFYPGSCLSISLPFQTPVYIRGKVAWCQEAIKKQSVLISDHKYRYRVGIQFYFATEAEKNAIYEFIQALMDPSKPIMQTCLPAHRGDVAV